MSSPQQPLGPGLSLAPFRALRPQVDAHRLATLLCPPYDVIDDAERARLLEVDPDNAVAVILPRTDAPNGDPYSSAAAELTDRVARGLYGTDPAPAVYVYEMVAPGQPATRGLLGAVELRDPADGVILPHENTMAGPVADRLALMDATNTNLEPIYLVYNGGGRASTHVAAVDAADALVRTRTPDGITHTLWALTDAEVQADIAADLATRSATIADGHHRYATYRELQRRRRDATGPGPWDRGLTLLVDSTEHGPQVHAIHRVIAAPLSTLVEAARPPVRVQPLPSPTEGLAALDTLDTFGVVLTDGDATHLLTDPSGELARRATRDGEPPALGALDVTVLHRALVQEVWGLADTEAVVGYAHSVPEAVADARRSGGTAVLLRPTPVQAVADVAAAGGRMPRKSTLFTPKPASGLVMRRFVDEH